MSKKYLESLEKIKQEFNCDPEYYGLGVDFEIVESALNRLETIDNAEPSEALECLEKLNGMEISSMPFSDEYGTQEVDLNDIRKVGSQLNTDFREYIDTIKQALLKAQEPKQYLKWEDLEFKEKTSRIEVKLNETLYSLSCVKRQYLDFVYLINNDSQIRLNSANDIQFFNDLHLEVIENE